MKRESFNPFTDTILIEKDGRIFQLHWRYKHLTLFAIGAGLGLSTYATLEQGKAAEEQGKIMQQAKYAEAKAQEEAGEYESRQKRKEKARAIATAIAEIGARGGKLTGTNLTNLASASAEYEADAWMLWRNRKVQANMLRYEGDIARYQGKMTRRASKIRAVGNLLTITPLLFGGAGSTSTTSAGRVGGGFSNPYYRTNFLSRTGGGYTNPNYRF